MTVSQTWRNCCTVAYCIKLFIEAKTFSACYVPAGKEDFGLPDTPHSPGVHHKPEIASGTSFAHPQNVLDEWLDRADIATCADRARRATAVVELISVVRI